MQNAQTDDAFIANDEIVLDLTFANLMPPPSKGERDRLVRDLTNTEGSLQRLVVWKQNRILLDDYVRFEICRDLNLPCCFRLIDFGSRELARNGLIRHQMDQRQYTLEALSYYRGWRYRNERQQHGGLKTRRGAKDKDYPLTTAQRLGLEYGVSEATIKNDSKLFRAIERIVVHCGESAKNLLLARETRLPKNAIVELSKRSPEAQKQCIQTLQERGRSPKRPKGSKPATIVVSNQPEGLVEKLAKCWTRAELTETIQRMTQVLGSLSELPENV